MKKVMYVITSLSHKRVFETFMPRDDMHQMVLGPKPKITNKKHIVPEDYSDFKIKDIRYYNSKREIQSVVNEFKPDVWVEASLPIARGVKIPTGCKKVYVSHGMVGNHVKGMIKKAGLNTSVWKGCDLYCGATKIFSEWVKHVAKVGDDKILINALPQLDILHNSNYYNSYRENVVKNTMNPNAAKIILFAGFCCKDRFDFKNHNEEYFNTVIKLEEIARKNNWLVMVKPRQTFGSMVSFLNCHQWGKKYVKKYTEIQNSKYLHFITTTGHIYRYFFADAIMLNGTSTIEVEACVINKPLFIVRTSPGCVDPYDIISSGAATMITDVSEVEVKLNKYFNDTSLHYPEKQINHIKSMGITFDGKMHERIQNRIARM